MDRVAFSFISGLSLSASEAEEEHEAKKIATQNTKNHLMWPILSLPLIGNTLALVPLSSEMGISPWIIIMIILMGSEVWFFPFQIDWHTLAYFTTEGKGFSYPLMCRLNPIYALAYILAVIAGIPYWRYLGLMG